MGQTQSTANLQTSVLRLISRMTYQSMQRASSVVQFAGNVRLDCRQFALDQLDAVADCLDDASKYGFTFDESVQVCHRQLVEPFRCTAQGIALNQVANVSLTASQQLEVFRQVRRDIETSLASQVPAGQDATQEINNLATAVETALIAHSQELYNPLVGKQTVNLAGAAVSFVSLDQAFDIALDIFQSDQAVLDASLRVAQTLRASIVGRTRAVRIVVIVVSVLIAGAIIWLTILAVQKSREVNTAPAETAAASSGIPVVEAKPGGAAGATRAPPPPPSKKSDQVRKSPSADVELTTFKSNAEGTTKPRPPATKPKRTQKPQSAAEKRRLAELFK